MGTAGIGVPVVGLLAGWRKANGARQFLDLVPFGSPSF